MGLFDTFVTFGIVAGAAFYLYRKFAKSKNGSGCSSGGGCCSGSSPKGSPGTCCGLHK